MFQIYKIDGNPAGFEDLNVFHKLAQQFLPFAHKRLGFDKPVSVNLLSDPQNAKNPLGKTAYYDPNKMKITLFVDKRHVKDVLRSMAHELVHHTQNCRGEFDGGVETRPGYAQEDGHMRKMEKEAYLEGQILLRDWEDGVKKENKTMSETYKRDRNNLEEEETVEEGRGHAGSCKSVHPEDPTKEGHKVWQEKQMIDEDEEPKIPMTGSLEESWPNGKKDQFLFKELTKKWTKK